jgi:glycerol-3-phosphate acyltransferase PlsY
LVLGSYLIGAVPFGRLIGKRVARIDIQKKGSGNIGATNVAREIGIGWGMVTLVLDVIKGLASVVAAKEILPGNPGGVSEAAGLAAVLGHQFSVFLGFKGGKGVATALGAFCGLEPLGCAASGIVFLAVGGLSGYVSVASMAGACSLPLAVGLVGGEGLTVATGAVVAVLICFKHRRNLERLARGEEPQVWALGAGRQERRSRRRSSSSSE